MKYTREISGGPEGVNLYWSFIYRFYDNIFYSKNVTRLSKYSKSLIFVICIIYRLKQQAEIRQSDVVEVGQEEGEGPCPEEGHDQ